MPPDAYAAQHPARRSPVNSYLDVFAALNSAGVRYVVVGGVAVVLQGHARMTVDLDLIVDLAGETARAALDLLTGMGFRPRLPVDPHDFADPDVRRDWVTHRHLQVFSLYDPDDPLREIDLSATHPLPFPELLAQADEIALGEVRVPVASIPHLVELKRAAGRPRDLEDIDALTRLLDRARRAMSEPVAAQWSAATFDGLEAQQRRDVADASPERRLAWLEEALRLAQASGALARVRRDRQQQCDQLWSGDGLAPSTRQESGLARRSQADT
jgi:predicted nucleotidyltransferase